MTDAVLADDGCRLWTTTVGRGYPLLLCHGGPGAWDMFDDLADDLAGEFSVIRWDQRGCGRSERRGPYSVAQSVADLDAVRRQVAGPRTALLGHSWGAMLALRYTLDHPDRVTRLIYVSGTGIDPERTWHTAYRRALRYRLGQHRPRWEALRKRLRTREEEQQLAVLQWSAEFVDPLTALRNAERLATPWRGINAECNASINAEVREYLHGKDLRARCRRLDTPVLIVDGSHDIRPRWAVDSLHQALSNAERITFYGAGHLPWVEQPRGFHEAVTAFMARESRTYGDVTFPPA